MTGRADMNEKRNVDWSVVFALAARAGSHELVRALTTAMKTECAALAAKYEDLLAHQRATCDEILCAQQAEFEQGHAELRCELLAMIDNEVTALREKLAAALAEVDRLRAAAQPAQ